MENECERITNRHIAKIMTQLDEIQIPEIVKEAVKKQMWFLSNDLKALYAGGLNEQVRI